MECLVYSSIKDIGVSSNYIKKVVFFVLQKIKVKGEISIHLVGDKKIRQLNKQYRGKDKTTDVLSFSVWGSPSPTKDQLGDIFISIPQIRRQAKVYGVSYQEELLRLLIHGLLHIVGHDHINSQQAKKMFTLQEKFIQQVL